MMNKRITGALFILLLATSGAVFAQKDTLHVLSYNILYLGDTPPCQGPHNVYEGYMKTIVSYANPDIAGFVKMEAIPMYTGDNSGNSPVGFADSLLQNTMNAAFPGRYAYCPYTNTSGASNISILYYNQQKLGYAGMLCSYSNITDFDTYKLYYKSIALDTTHDTAFLYVTLNHDNSGSSNSDATTRGQQIGGEMAQIETHFTVLPNMINMGDFNTHNSTEACYQTLVAPSNLKYRYYDPPFFPDTKYTYPADWDNNPSTYADCLTTSTRSSSSAPNSCSGSSGGGKSWYDHIFLSANIINDSNHIGYVPHSFHVIGNDGQRTGKAVNGSPTNTSAPSTVTNAIYQISEHYPLALDLYVNVPLAPVDTDTVKTSVNTLHALDNKVTVVNPVDKQIDMRFSKGLADKTIQMACTDMLGRLQMKSDIQPSNGMAQVPCTLAPGIYLLTFTTDGHPVSQVMIQKR